MSRYVFSYFINQSADDGEQVRFARSVGDDGLRWEPLNGGRPVLTWTGGRGGARDPFLLRAAGLPGETAAFYLLATDMRAHGHDTKDFWEADQRHGSRSIVVWESVDLVTWSEPRLVEVSPPEAGNTWAPEATFDPVAAEYFVYWASKLYEDDGSGTRVDESYNRMLASTTRDFRSFSEAVVWADPGRSVIDATIMHDGEYFYRFLKDERTPDSSTPEAKFITVERSTNLRATEWEPVTDGVGRSIPGHDGLVHGEGPIVVARDGDGSWVLLIDEFGLRSYVPFVGDSLDTNEWRIADDYLMPPGARHGSVLAVTEEEWERLGSAWPAQ
ncbi:MAG: beta-xylosidase [Frondihabitans sp.]|nr:beta-xylosidase [Frondihabitans sp.]